MNSPKLKGSLLERLNKDEMNRIARLHMRINYSWLNSFVRKKSGRWKMDENNFVVPIARLLHFVRTLNLVKNCVPSLCE